MGADAVTPTLFLAILGLVGCAMILVSVVLDYVWPQKFTGWTLTEALVELRNSGTKP